ncbi:hypothetical protein ACGF5M_00915 [Gemmatimonadota bacterium]
MDRYWTRFNIFAAVQIGALVGIVNGASFLAANPNISRLVLAFLLLFSITGAVNIVRGHDLQRSFVLALGETERDLPERERLLHLTSSFFRLPTFVGNYTCSMFAVACCVLWVGALVWFELGGGAKLVLPAGGIQP